MNKLTESEAISKLEKIYNTNFDSTSELNAYDQLLACEILSNVEKASLKENVISNQNVSVKWNENENGTYKRVLNSEINLSKKKAISELKNCNYKTSPVKLTYLLEQAFIEYSTEPGHWLYIAQHLPPRTINRVLNGMIKTHQTKWETIQNPPAYFTYTIKRFYKQRKKFRK